MTEREGEPHIETIEGCPFCEIVQNKEEASKIIETDDVIAFMSFEGHPMVMPRTHISGRDLEANQDVVLKTYEIALSLVESTRKVLGATGINIVTNLGEGSGQEVDHLHIHLIDRSRGDRKVVFAVGDRHPRQELDNRASKIRSLIKEN